MITGLVGFLGSSAGGAFLGLITNWLADRREDQKEKRESARLTRMAELGAVSDYAKQLDVTTPGKIKKLTRSIKLWGLQYDRTTYKLFPTNIYSPRALVIAACIGLLVFTYCSVLFIFAIEPYWIIYTFQPEETPRKINLLIWSYEWTRTEPYELNSGGVAYLMAHPLIFIISTAIVGTIKKLNR